MKRKGDIFVLLAVSLAVASAVSLAASLAALLTTVHVGALEKGIMLLDLLNVSELALHTALLAVGIWIGHHWIRLLAWFLGGTDANDTGPAPRNRPPEGPTWNGGAPR